MCIEDRLPTPTMIKSSLSNSDSVSMKHIRKTFTHGRKLSIDVEAGLDNSFVSLASSTPANDRLKDLIASTWQGMRSGYSPALCDVGVGGTYFMKDSSNKRIGVFKPNDEEMGCLNNPKGFTPMSAGYTDSSKSRGVMGGEAAFRECAAYVLDHEHFSGVPATDLVACSYPGFQSSPVSGTPLSDENIKLGSFQEFKEHDFDAEDISPVKAGRFPVNEVHKIAILDIRLFNTDRHGGNILIRKVYSPLPRKYGEDDFESPRRREYNSDADENGAQMQFRLDMESDDEDMSSLTSSVSSLEMEEEEEVATFELIPIDHGYTLPQTVSGLTDSWFEWLNWPQSKVPFDEETKKYIERLDAEHDVSLLTQKFGEWIPADCYKVLRITTMWLKQGARLNLSPYEIGVRMCRRQVDTPSDLEKICRAAEEASQQTLNSPGNVAADALFFVRLAELMESKLKEVANTPTIPTRKLFA